MIFLITGLPRNGKTLYAIDTIEKKRIKENRPVYYHHIDELKLDWIEFKDPTKWNELPEGAIIVFDEAHKFFPARSRQSKTPEHVVPFDEHGHKGYDIFLITQEPKDIDPYIASRTQNHQHVVRKFGGERAVIHSWLTGVNLQAITNRRDSITNNYSYNKKLYGTYKSAVEHNVKRNIPMRYILLLCMPFVIVALAYFGFSGLLSSSDEASKIALDTSDPKRENTYTSGKPAILNQNEVMTTAQYVESYQPRIEGLPHTAPRYDEITKPTRAPVPAGCVHFKSSCTCYTQKGTKLPTDENVCKQIVKNGFFIDFEPEPLQQKNDQVNLQSSNYSGVSGALDPDVSWQPVVMDDKPLRASPSPS